MAGKLKGQNRIRKFKKIAKGIASKIATYEGVTGIVFLGGLARGFADRYSDLDIVVFLDERDEHLRRRIYDLGLNEEGRSDIDMDLEVHFLEDFKRWRWDEIDRWEFSEAKIVFDPKGKINKAFREKSMVPKDFWIKRTAVCAEYLKWYCCPPKEEVGTIAGAWIDRGDLLASHYCLNYAIDLLLMVIFALNKEHLPAPKWRIFYSYRLKWLPEGYEGLIKEAMEVRNFSVRDFSRRLKAMRKMWHEILPKIEDQTGLTMDRLSKYYVEEILHQSWIPRKT